MMMNKQSTILVVAAHPDDEILGCGGCVYKWAQDGASVHALILAEGLTSRAAQRTDIPQEELDGLRKHARQSAETIGFQSISFESFPDNRMDSVDLLDVIHALSRYIDRIQPQIILTHHHGDLNVDHRIAFQAVITACRPLPECPVQTIFTFDTPSATEWNFPYYKNTFSPNTFIDISQQMEQKLAAMACYQTESREAPHPRSPESLRAIAKRWGSVINCDYAEAFELIRTTAFS